MERANKKEKVAALHKEVILSAAQALFLEKGVELTTIADISQKSQYSRRTIYAYYQSKQDMVHHIVLNGLSALNQDLENAVCCPRSFVQQYTKICSAMMQYHINCPQSLDAVNQVKPDTIDFQAASETVLKIFQMGTQINQLLANWIETGIEQGVVKADVKPMHTVYILWGCISSLICLVQTKGVFLEKELQTSQREFLKYGFGQILNAILTKPI